MLQPNAHGSQTTGEGLFASHLALLKTLALLAVIFEHAAMPFTEPNPEGFWKFYADRQSARKMASGAFMLPSSAMLEGLSISLSDVFAG
jgi:hypothetical protein